MLGLAAVPSVIQFVGFFFMPESPRWLIEHGRYDEAKRVLLQTQGSKQLADEEFEIMKQTFEDDEKERLEKGKCYRRSVVLQLTIGSSFWL